MLRNMRLQFLYMSIFTVFFGLKVLTDGEIFSRRLIPFPRFSDGEVYGLALLCCFAAVVHRLKSGKNRIIPITFVLSAPWFFWQTLELRDAASIFSRTRSDVFVHIYLSWAIALLSFVALAVTPCVFYYSTLGLLCVWKRATAAWRDAHEFRTCGLLPAPILADAMLIFCFGKEEAGDCIDNLYVRFARRSRVSSGSAHREYWMFAFGVVSHHLSRMLLRRAELELVDIKVSGGRWLRGFVTRR